MTDETPEAEASVIEATRIPLDLDAELEVIVVPASSRALIADFEMQDQCHSNWCWAAVAASVSDFYSKAASLTQCALANLELHRSDCCSVPCHMDNIDFNETHTLGSPLNRVGCLVRMTRNQRATRAEVQQEIGAGRPICVRTLWSGAGPNGGAHFLAIVGYSPGTDKVLLADPWFSASEMTYDHFCTQYQDAGGVWTDSYYTRSP